MSRPQQCRTLSHCRALHQCQVLHQCWPLHQHRAPSPRCWALHQHRAPSPGAGPSTSTWPHQVVGSSSSSGSPGPGVGASVQVGPWASSGPGWWCSPGHQVEPAPQTLTHGSSVKDLESQRFPLLNLEVLEPFEGGTCPLYCTNTLQVNIEGPAVLTQRKPMNKCTSSYMGRNRTTCHTVTSQRPYVTRSQPRQAVTTSLFACCHPQCPHTLISPPTSCCKAHLKYNATLLATIPSQVNNLLPHMLSRGSLNLSLYFAHLTLFFPRNLKHHDKHGIFSLQSSFSL